jgi:hypothetical protein
MPAAGCAGKRAGILDRIVRSGAGCVVIAGVVSAGATLQ